VAIGKGPFHEPPLRGFPAGLTRCLPPPPNTPLRKQIDTCVVYWTFSFRSTLLALLGDFSVFFPPSPPFSFFSRYRLSSHFSPLRTFSAGRNPSSLLHGLKGPRNFPSFLFPEPSPFSPPPFPLNVKRDSRPFSVPRASRSRPCFLARVSSPRPPFFAL